MNRNAERQSKHRDKRKMLVYQCKELALALKSEICHGNDTEYQVTLLNNILQRLNKL